MSSNLRFQKRQNGVGKVKAYKILRDVKRNRDCVFMVFSNARTRNQMKLASGSYRSWFSISALLNSWVPCHRIVQMPKVYIGLKGDKFLQEKSIRIYNTCENNVWPRKLQMVRSWVVGAETETRKHKKKICIFSWKLLAIELWWIFKYFICENKITW